MNDLSQVGRDMPATACLTIMDTNVMIWETSSCTVEFELIQCPSREVAARVFTETAAILADPES